MRPIDADKLNIIGSQEIENAQTLNVIVIPDNATNGDVINILYPKCRAVESEIGDVKVHVLDTGIVASLEWWNSPYQMQ